MPRVCPSAAPRGDVTRAEAQAKAQTMFDKMDVNHDGVLNQADREAQHGADVRRIDANHDGAISRDEFMAAHQRMGHGGEQRGDHRMDADRQGNAIAGGMHRGGKHHGAYGWQDADAHGRSKPHRQRDEAGLRRMPP